MMLVFSTVVLAQSNDVSKRRTDLNQIRKEIEQFEQQLKTEAQKEADILEMLDNIDREIDLTHSLLDDLSQEEKDKLQAIRTIGQTIKEKRLELERLQEIYAKRMVNFYKRGRRTDIELLLSAQSFNQVLLWLKYQKALSDNDKRNYENIVEKKQTIETQIRDLRKEYKSNKEILAEKTAEEENLRKRREERNELLATVRQNKQLYLEKLREYEISAKEIERLISVQEEQRVSKGIEGVLEETDFPKLKGKMNWPTNGEIVTGFGKYKHPQLKTITESIGIDIKADYGQEVRVVGNGKVTAITWQRGRGNIVIVNHYGGYYSVYTHLSSIFVKVDSEVHTGEVIGEVGDTGSLRGPMLHFEIWQNNKVLNPEHWLS
ncbi:peptidoglycan DD-metalloendopeptidase family protein [candidate division KSB1 bacterium]|nr:peptidoglycan DD-metalloendopeptidase family protein [candidate division KSB1 bacterium]